MTALLPTLSEAPDAEAIRFGDRALSHRALRDVGADLAAKLGDAERVAVWAAPTLETCAAVLGAMAAGRTVVPVNPKAGERELEHVVGDSRLDAVVAARGAELPGALAALPRALLDLDARGGDLPDEPDGERAVLVVYTSGTTGAPKGAVLSRRALATNLDALAAAWGWTGDDALVHGLPLFHVHGLVLGVVGPVRRGGRLVHVGRFSAEAVAAALRGGATMLFGVPTMYRRLLLAVEADPAIAAAVRGARLLVSGSAALPAADHERLERATGQRVVERYGLTETLMNCAVRADGDRRPGYVGPPLDGVEVRVIADDGGEVPADDATIGELLVRGPNLFSGYLNRPEATATALRDGFFATGDLATRAGDGYVRIVGRRATDLIKTGGFKVGAGEVENALLEHPGVAEVAVTGEPDDELGERIVAWVVRAGSGASAQELSAQVARLLTPHKRPREVRFVAELPRNEMGKVRKSALRPPSP